MGLRGSRLEIRIVDDTPEAAEQHETPRRSEGSEEQDHTRRREWQGNAAQCLSDEQQGRRTPVLRTWENDSEPESEGHPPAYPGGYDPPSGHCSSINTAHRDPDDPQGYVGRGEKYDRCRFMGPWHPNARNKDGTHKRNHIDRCGNSTRWPINEVHWDELKRTGFCLIHSNSEHARQHRRAYVLANPDRYR